MHLQLLYMCLYFVKLIVVWVMQKQFCYGSLGAQMITVVVTILGLLKEIIPLFYEVAWNMQFNRMKIL